MKKYISLSKMIKYSIPIGLLLISYSINLLFVVTALGSLHDFGSFIAAGQMDLQHQDPYSINSPLVFAIKFNGINLEGYAPNLNPPISVLLFRSIAPINPVISVNIWRAISILLFCLSVIILDRAFKTTGFYKFFRIAWAFSIAGFWHTIQLGQIYCFILFFIILAIVSMRNNKLILAGVCLGVVISIKPNFVFWAILLVFIGNWKTFLAAGFSAMTISSIPLLTHGLKIYQQWLNASSNFTPNLLLFPGNNSFQGLTSRIGLSNLGILLSLIIAAAVMWFTYRTKPDWMKTNRLGIVVSLLISPIAWTGYTLLVLPVFFLENEWKWDLKITATIFSIPVIFSLVLFQTSFANFVIFGWLYGWGLLVLLYGTFIKPDIVKGKIDAMIRSIHTN